MQAPPRRKGKYQHIWFDSEDSENKGNVNFDSDTSKDKVNIKTKTTFRKGFVAKIWWLQPLQSKVHL